MAQSKREFAKYFTSSDSFILLGAERIYMQFFFDSVCQLDRGGQIQELVSRLSDPDTDFPYLCSIYYLLMDHEVGIRDEKSKALRFCFKGDLVSATTSMVVIESGLMLLNSEALKPEKTEENVQHRMKAIADLIFCLVCFHFESLKFLLPNYPGLLDLALSTCFRAIKLSLEKPGINLKRVSALLLKFYQIKFREALEEEDLEAELSDAEKTDQLERMKNLVDSPELSLDQLIRLSQHREIERYYGSVMGDPANPLPTVLVVGYLRALLNLVTTFRAKNSTGFDCTSELEATYLFMVNFMRDLQDVNDVYKVKLQNKRQQFPQTFILHSMNLDKYETLPELSASFVELKNLTKFKELTLKDLDILPDSLHKLLEEQNAQETKNEEEIQALTSVLSEVMTHRIVSIYFMTAAFALLHKLFRLNNYFQALSLGNYIYEAKGILVMLKIIAEKILQNEAPLDLGSFAMDASQGGFQLDDRSCPIEGVVENVLYLFYSVIYDCNDIVNTCLNDFKAQSVFKKYSKLFKNNRAIAKFSYLLIKKQMDIMPKRVKSNQMNMKILSYSYCLENINEVKGLPRSLEDADHSSAISSSIKLNRSIDSSFQASNSVSHYLTTTQPLAEGRLNPLAKFETNHDTIKKICSAVNAVYLKHRDEFLDTLEARVARDAIRLQRPTVTQLYNKLYSKIRLPDNFEIYYEKWLEEEVFGLLE